MDYSKQCKFCGRSFQEKNRRTVSYETSSFARKGQVTECNAQRAGYCSSLCQARDQAKVAVVFALIAIAVGVVLVILSFYLGILFILFGIFVGMVSGIWVIIGKIEVNRTCKKRQYLKKMLADRET